MGDQDLPCNFLEYLAWRLGQRPDATSQMLGEWLASYERERPSGPCTRELARACGRASALG